MQQENYHILINKLDEFIRRYYKNTLIRGSIYFTSLFLLFFLSVTTWEYFTFSGTIMRTILFYAFILVNGSVFVRLILLPVFRMNRLGKTISHEEAAKIIGNHFQEIRDKLLNTLQLHNSMQPDQFSAELIEASINQKIKELKPIPFTAAVNLKENRKYARYALIPALVFITIALSVPDLITESTARLLRYNADFAKPLPFTFAIQNKELKAVQQEDFLLEVKLSGKEIPNEIFIEIGSNTYRLEKENTISFQHLFKNIQKDQVFRLMGDGYYSEEFKITALPNPLLLRFGITLDYPAYLGKSRETLSNTGDLVIPAGTKVSWNFQTRNTDKIRLRFSDSIYISMQKDENSFAFTRRFLLSNSYVLSTSNEFLTGKDSVSYSIVVVPDQYPAIQVEEAKDSLYSKRLFFKGLVKDDYGFQKLTFNYHFINNKDNDQKIYSENIPVGKQTVQDQFFHFWDLSSITISPGDEIEYYFEIWDNDGVTGSKATRSQSLIFKAPTNKELAENTEKKNDEIRNELKESLIEAQKLQKDLDKFNKELHDKKQVNWEDKKKAEDLVNRQQKLEHKIKNIQQQSKQSMSRQSEFSEVNQELLEKQQELNELLEKMLPDEIKKLMEELQRLMQNMEKDKLQEMMEKMKYSAKDVEKELDRSLELFKQLELEQKMKQVTDDLKQLSKEEETLSEKSLEKNAEAKELEKKQDDLNKQFEDLKKDLKELDQKNKELEFPNEMENTDQQQEEISKDMEESEQQLNENKKKQASQSQKKAAQKMKQLSEKMEQMMSSMQMEQMEEDMSALRDLLENLLKLSFEQEGLMNDLKTVDSSNPQYMKLVQKQLKLKEDAKILEDSLLALSKRVFQIKSAVNQEISSINHNMAKALDLLEGSKAPAPNQNGNNLQGEARGRQQYVMTSVNNLALLLSEVLDAMQQQMAQQMPSNSSCKKPGSCSKPGNCNKPGHGAGKKPSASSIKKLQEQLNQQIKQLKEGGMSPAGGKQGSQKSLSEQLAKLAAQQEAIRNELQKLNQEENKNGKGDLGNLEQIAQEMEKTEADLVNKMISLETLKRQQDILTRLLEAENAERERELDEKRESNETKVDNKRNPAGFEEYKRLKLKEIELLKTVPPSLNSFYRKKVNEYFQTIQK